jgi:CDP-glucose 4,6-dehydratase
MRRAGLFGNAYDGTRVFLTGNTGFKGSWLHLWLEALGARVTGFSLAPPSEPFHFPLLDLDGPTVTGDIRDRAQLARAMAEARPDIVFHLAAQPLVRRSYTQAPETFETNVMGTVNLFEACRATPSVRAVVNITSDKCYEQLESPRGYVESDPMGGHDPYSCSKGCAELVTASYRRSFFAPSQPPVLLSSVRAGNVIGGGDWGEDRLIPDMMRAAAQNRECVIRSPLSVRPWQHVLEPLCGYLMLGRRLLNGETVFADGWNFGPANNSFLTVVEVAEAVAAHWPAARHRASPPSNAPHEAAMLRLDTRKAQEELDWIPLWDTKRGITETARWYKAYYEDGEVLTRQQLETYVNEARQANRAWTENAE